MFVLSIIKDTVAVLPAHFGLPPEQAIINELNKKYANRVLHEVGLCMCVFDLSEVGEGKVRYGDGCLWYKAESTSPHDLLDSPTTERMYIDPGEILRVRVEADEFYDDEPGPPKATEGVQQAKTEARRAPYTITQSRGLDLYLGGRMLESNPWTRVDSIERSVVV
ncbi:hypothetical protein EIP86_010388 [Pleurotus ostreatoroseus]|nr:hypothetical protein EIP86_010388 [Pleurotus ostreatoroseus]